MSDAFWDALHPPSRALQYKHILTDLIAELRGMAEHDGHLTEWIGPNLDRAEERLREVRGEL